MGMMLMPIVSRRLFLRLAATAPLGVLAGCQTTPCIFGYKLGAGALYDENITSVYVPVFHNRAFQTTPYRGLEVDITQAVIREIGRTTSFRVISDPSCADTELLGAVVQIQKQIMNRNQQNMVRDGDVIVDVDVVWRDLRTNEILSMPRRPRRSRWACFRASRNRRPSTPASRSRRRPAASRRPSSQRASPASAGTYPNSARPTPPPPSASRTRLPCRSCR